MESSFFQYPINMLLSHDANHRTIIDCVTRSFPLVQNAGAAMIYLYQDDIEASFEKTVKEPRWHWRTLMVSRRSKRGSSECLLTPSRARATQRRRHANHAEAAWFVNVHSPNGVHASSGIRAVQNEKTRMLYCLQQASMGCVRTRVPTTALAT